MSYESSYSYSVIGNCITRSVDISPYANVIEAASAGASAAIPLVANIVVNIIAFMALVEFINTTLTWMGHRVGLWPPEYPELSFWVSLITQFILAEKYPESVYTYMYLQMD